MSIAAISSSFTVGVAERVLPGAVDAANAARSLTRTQHEGGRRHELVGTMNRMLGIEPEPSRAQAQAVFRFAHALMHELRDIDGGAERAGRGRASAGLRRASSDLPQRIDALATAATAPDAAAAPTDLPPVPPTPRVGSDVPSADAEGPVAELPPQPNPLTTTSAALHLMQVPSSRLLEAYAALRQALGEQSAASPAHALRSDLAAFLDRLSKSLGSGAAATLPAGSVMNLTA